MSKAGFRIQTPRGSILITRHGKAVLTWSPGTGKRVTGTLDIVQAWIDNEVLVRCSPYVPMDTSMLNKSGLLYTVPGSGEVIYNTPYARKWYFKPALFQGAPMRGNYWFERMKGEGGREAILRGAQRILRMQIGGR
jgi:hypothetical protein